MTGRPGQEPTEPATPRKRRRAREQGHVAYSARVSATLHLLALCVGLAALVQGAALGLAGFAARCLRLEVPWDTALVEALWVFFRITWPFLALGFAIALASGLAQTGLHLNWSRLRPRPENLSWRQGLGRVFSRRAWSRLAWGLPFLVLFLGLAPALLWWRRAEVLGLAGGGVTDRLADAGGLFGRLLWAQFALVAAFGLADVILTIRRHRRELMMTRKEVEDEFRREEGDPRLKSERRAIFERQLAATPERRIIQEAKVLIVNPEHVAVAVGVDETRSPVILARAHGAPVARYKELARRAGVPVVRDARLARALYALQEEQELPMELLEALAMVFVTLGIE